MFPFDISHVLCQVSTLSMETSPSTPCYDAERLETKTHVGLGQGESIEYTKHRLSLEGHPWTGCRPVSDTWRPYGQTKQKRGLNNVDQVNPEDCCLSRKNSGLQDGEIQARTSRPPHKCLKWTMPRKRRCLWWNGFWLRWGTGTPRRSMLMCVIASNNHLEILCFVTRPPLARLTKPTKSCSDFL